MKIIKVISIYLSTKNTIVVCLFVCVCVRSELIERTMGLIH